MATDGGPLPFLEADALRLPFPENSFDLITTAFGFRNLANYESGLRDLVRLIGSVDKREIIIKGGHVGLVAGRGAEKRMWPALEAWLAERSV